VAKRAGVEPFPFMAKVWATMKQLHGSDAGGTAPNDLAGKIGLGQKDLFDGSTTPGGKAGQKMLRQVMKGGTELLAPTGVSKRAVTMQGEDEAARNLLKVAKDADYKGLRVQRHGKVENIMDREAYKTEVSNRSDKTSFDKALKNSQQAVQKRMTGRKETMAQSVEDLAQHIVKRWKKGTENQPLLPKLGKPDEKLVFQRVMELLAPDKAEKAKYKQAMKPPAQKKLF
jgi:hypothetical protein